MDRQEYTAWLSEIDELSADQRAEAGRALAGQPSLEAAVCLLEELIGAERRCPHCAAEGAFNGAPGLEPGIPLIKSKHLEFSKPKLVQTAKRHQLPATKQLPPADLTFSQMPTADSLPRLPTLSR